MIAYPRVFHYYFPQGAECSPGRTMNKAPALPQMGHIRGRPVGLPAVVVEPVSAALAGVYLLLSLLMRSLSRYENAPLSHLI